MAALTIWTIFVVIAPLGAYIADEIIYPRLKENNDE